MAIRPSPALALVALLSGCVAGMTRRPTDDPGLAGDPSIDAISIEDTAADCPEGQICNPIPVTHFPFFDQRDTTVFSESEIDTLVGGMREAADVVMAALIKEGAWRA